MENQKELKKSLSLLDATLIVSGSMIGSGIFIVTADMTRLLGGVGWVLLVWVITGAITVFAALSYGELAGMMPKAGGQFVYIQRAFGRLTSFVYGWSVFMVIQTGVIAAVAVAFAKFLGVFFPALGPDNSIFNIGTFKVSAAQAVAICNIALLTFINTKGVKNGKIIQLIFTLAKLFALFALIIIGIWFGLNLDYYTINWSHAWEATTTNPTTGMVTGISGVALLLALGTASVGSLFSSDAWNNVTFIAGEIKNPSRNIPLSLFFGTFIVTVVYILANVAYTALLPSAGDINGTDVISRGIAFAQYDRVGTAAATTIFGNVAAYIMAGLIVVSTFGCNNGLILAGSRLYYAMAKDGLFFKKAGELNQHEVPGFALWTQCFWASLLCLSGTYGDLLDYCTFASLIFYIVTIMALFVLRKKEPHTERPYTAFGYPIIPILYIMLATTICVILLMEKTSNTGKGLLIVLLGVPVYFIAQKAMSKKTT